MKKWKDNNRLYESENDGRVAVYVGTYGKYNEGTLQGAWMYPGDYDSLDEFLDACRELHKDEPDAELMFQDAENLPDRLYDESYFSDEAFDYAKYVDDNGDAGAAEAYVNLFGEWDEMDFDDRYIGDFDSDEDMAWDYIENCGGIADAVSDPSTYFDYDLFGRDMKMEMDSEDEYESKFFDMSDSDAAYEYIDEIGGIEQLGKDTIERYFDISLFARDCMMGDVVADDGHYFHG